MAPIIGFDFDECLAQAYTFVPFALFLETLLPRATRLAGVSSATRVLLEKSRSSFYHLVAVNEANSKGTLLRPSLLRLLPKLLALRQQGQIGSLFLYSNNGIKVLLEALDHILALTLQREPYRVPANQLVQDSDGRIHCLSPRAFVDEPCRASEPKESNGFREKSFGGIQACLGSAITTDQLWYLDDTRMHDSLMASIGERYVVVKPYNVKLSNKRLAEMFVEAFPNVAFQPNSREGAVVLTQLQLLMPGFIPTGRESAKSLAEKLSRELGKFSPLGSGRVARGWTPVETQQDLLLLEQALAGATAPAAAEPNRTMIGGGQIGRGSGPRTARRKRNLGERTRRRRAL